MKISELTTDQHPVTQLGSYVLAVISRRVEGTWCLYVDRVPGEDHRQEWYKVYAEGTKQDEEVAKAIVKNLFHPGFEVDLPYDP